PGAPASPSRFRGRTSASAFSAAFVPLRYIRILDGLSGCSERAERPCFESVVQSSGMGRVHRGDSYDHIEKDERKIGKTQERAGRRGASCTRAAADSECGKRPV